MGGQSHRQITPNTPLRRARCLLRVWLVQFVAMLVVMVSILHATTVAAQESEAKLDPQKEYNLKAAFMYGFGRYITWRAPSANSGDFKIGVIGDSIILDTLRQVAQKRNLSGRRMTVETVTLDDDLASYRLVFVSRDVAPEQATRIIEASLPDTIVIAERDELLSLGASAVFFIDGTTVRFELNRQNLQAKDVQLDAKLLRLSRSR